MMLLGVVLHAGVTYLDGDPSRGWPLRDPNAPGGLFQLWLFFYIHIFRMPIFMIVAGFFAALLFYERSPGQMLSNRVKRIVWPFLVGIVILWPLATLSMSYSNRVFSWSGSFKSSFGTMYSDTTLSSFLDLCAFVPQALMHLWFLYYLILFSLLSFALGHLFSKKGLSDSKLSVAFRWIVKRPVIRVLVFVGLSYGLFQITDRRTYFEFIPNPNTFIYYFYFYAFGWMLHSVKDALPTFMRFDWASVILGTLACTAYLVLSKLGIVAFGTVSKNIIYAFCLWTLIFGIAGLFLRYFSEHSKTMRYLSDASYWVYLVHLPVAVLMPGLIGVLDLPSFAKFAIVVAATSAVCFITYHFLVRSTFIGKFLNGKTYPRKLNPFGDTKPTPEN